MPERMTEAEENLARLLDGLSETRIRQLGIEAIRRVRVNVRRGGGDPDSTIRLDPATIMRELGPLLRAAGDAAADLPLPPMGDDTWHKLWSAKLLVFFVWLERAGLAFHYDNGTANPLRVIRLLPTGIAFFDRADDQHPLVPGSIARMRRRSPGLPEHVLELIEDSHKCFEYGDRLLRPAVALLGVAWESIVSTVHESMMRNGLAADAQNAARKIEAVRAGIDARFPLDNLQGQERIDMLERRGAARRACEFADDVRGRRNPAAHDAMPRIPFDDPQEVENFLMRAEMNIPGLWAMHQP